jgi:tyrosine-specific transport protein
MERKKFFEAVSILIGTIIGAGIFGLPYVMMRAGVLVNVFYFLFLGSIVLIIHLILGEIALRTPGFHHVVGYGKIYLGNLGEKIFLISSLVSLSGSLLVYLILGGHFLKNIFDWNNNFLFFLLIFWFFNSFVIILGWQKASFFELLMTFSLILILSIFSLLSLKYFRIDNLKLIDIKYLFLPWGVIFYAISGGLVIPELREFLIGKEFYLKKIIILGTILPIIFYFIFAISVAGALGLKTSEETINGLKNLFNPYIIKLIVIFGLFSIATSYLVMGMVLKRIFIHDLKINKKIANLIVCFTPLCFYFLGFKNFIKIISFLGLWLGAVDGILVLLVHKKAKSSSKRFPEYSLNFSNFVYYLIMIVFLLGPILNLIFLRY